MGTPRRDGDRVIAEVDGHPVWFESADRRLALVPEAWASSILLAAAAHGRALWIRPAVDRRWLDGAARVLDVAEEWWGWSAPVPRAHPRPWWQRPPSTRPRGVGAPVRRLGLCFSGGADSFDTLLRHERRVDTLVTAIGYDTKLEDEDRAASMERSVRAVGRALDREVVVIRTNLLDHPLHRATDWSWTHGGPMAALGHLLTGHLAELVISASYPRALPAPWGSRWDLDPHWSASVRIAHAGEDRWRSEKLAGLAGEPIVQRHLRVCWEHRTPDENCGHCEKCLRTAVALLASGGLEHFTGMPQRDVLADRLRQLELPGAAQVSLGNLLAAGLPADFPEDVAEVIRGWDVGPADERSAG